MSNRPEYDYTSFMNAPDDKSLSSGYVCMDNKTEMTVYIRLLYDDGGVANFTLGPGQSDRRGYKPGFMCFDFNSSIGSSCPNRTRIVANCN